MSFFSFAWDFKRLKQTRSLTRHRMERKDPGCNSAGKNTICSSFIAGHAYEFPLPLLFCLNHHLQGNFHHHRILKLRILSHFNKRFLSDHLQLKKMPIHLNRHLKQPRSIQHHFFLAIRILCSSRFIGPTFEWAKIDSFKRGVSANPRKLRSRHLRQMESEYELRKRSIVYTYASIEEQQR